MMAKKRSRFTTYARCVSTVAVGFSLLAGTQTTMAGNTVRDHRGPNGVSQGGVMVDGKPVKVTTAPALGGPKYKGGYDGLKGGASGKGDPNAGAIVRDHRPR